MVRLHFFRHAMISVFFPGGIALLLTGCGESFDRSSREPSVESTAAAATPVTEADDGPQLDSPLWEPDDPDSDATSAESVSSTEEAVPDESAATAPQPASASSARAKREPIYVEQANGKALIAAALEKAKQDHKHVLIEWGGNWCGWCYKLHDVFHHDETVSPIVRKQFELVLIDEGQNRDLMLEYGGKDRQYSFPHLTILDEDGRVLVNQETGSLEEGPRHDPKLVSDFLTKWIPGQHE